ncbi:hypothetical protein Taro_045166 [Colocasia esculenta]|uniref:SKP1-like protein n=1 Tax=Colocasia esculenta TaxID=4460 RepID=A0A843X683_COLES|nr:hypothetical protein [Colocasia esculenta]
MSSPSSSTGRKMLVLRSFDGEEFKVEESVARLSETVKLLMEDGCADDDHIPLPNITGEALAKVLEYCKKHAAVGEESAVKKGETAAEKDAAVGESGEEKGKTVAEKDAAVGEESAAKKGETAAEKDLKEWDEGYIDVDMDILHSIIMTAHYLEVKGLMDLAMRRIVNLIKGKTPEQIRQTFGIRNDFSPEEEEEIQKQNQWAFE